MATVLATREYGMTQ